MAIRAEMINVPTQGLSSFILNSTCVTAASALLRRPPHDRVRSAHERTGRRAGVRANGPALTAAPVLAELSVIGSWMAHGYLQRSLADYSC